MSNNDKISSQFCTNHSSSAVVACAKLWPDWLIMMGVKVKTKSQDFNMSLLTLQWYHDNEHDGISNDQPQIVYSTIYSDADQRKHQSSASLAFVREIHRSPVNSPHKGQWLGNCFHLMTSSWTICERVPGYFDLWNLIFQYPHILFLKLYLPVWYWFEVLLDIMRS